jgi:hypothetical protein
MRRLDFSRLWTGRHDEVLTSGSILIGEDGRVNSIEGNCCSDTSVFVMPAFVDAHSHFTAMGLAESLTDLSGVSSAGDLLEMVSSAVARGEGILQCGRFDESEWSRPDLPSLEQLDSATGDRPVFIRRVCGHLALVNSAMMSILPSDTPDLERAAGILREDMVLNFNTYFPPSRGALEKAVSDASRKALASGVTAVGSMESFTNLEFLSGIDAGVRLSCSVFWQDLVPFLESSLPERKGEFFVQGVKLFLDGALGAKNAAVSEGFLDAPSGELIYSDDELLRVLERIGDLGMTPVLHAIGAIALEQIDRVYSLLDTQEYTDFRIRIEHAEELVPAWPGNWNPELHVFSMQPNFVNRWQMPGGLYYSRLPCSRVLQLNPFGLLTEAGFLLGFGSDCMPFGPLRGLGGATGHPFAGFRLSIDQALRAYTLGAAEICCFKELSRPVEPGRPADLIVLSGDPFTGIPFEELTIVATLKDGMIVYDTDNPLLKTE